MEMKLNELTNVEVNAKLSIFREKDKNNNNYKVVYVRNDKIFASDVAWVREFHYPLFLSLFLAGVFGGFAHYTYDTMILGYNPNPPIIFGIFFVFVVVGFIISFRKKRYFSIVVASDGPGASSKDTFRFEVGKDVSDKKLEDLMYVLVN